jgi:hypothetical protein
VAYQTWDKEGEIVSKKSHNEETDTQNALFGAPEDLDLVEALEDLAVAGINSEELCSRMYDKLCLEARAYRMRQEELPPLLRKALDDLRPSSAPARTQEELDRRAGSTISRIMSAIKANFSLPADVSGLKLSQSFRNKKSQKSAKDQRIINSLEEELLNDLEREEKDDRD